MVSSNQSAEHVQPGTVPKRLPQLELVRGLLADRGEIQATALTGTLPGIEAAGLSLETARISIRVMESNFERLSAKETRWDGCDLSNCAMSHSTWRDTAFVASRMTGISFAEAELTDMLFDDCKIDLSNFRFAKLSAITFRGCDLSAADFANTEMTGVTFDHCNLSGGQFFHSLLRNVDLRGSSLSGIAGIDGLSGATITADQLLELSAQLAAHAGLIVKD